MAATGIIEYLPVWDTELPIHQPPVLRWTLTPGRALRPPAPQPSPSLYRLTLYTVILALQLAFYLLGYLGYKMENGTSGTSYYSFLITFYS